MLCPILARRHAGLFLEDDAEVFDMREAAAFGDVGERKIGLSQQRFHAIQLDAEDSSCGVPLVAPNSRTIFDANLPK